MREVDSYYGGSNRAHTAVSNGCADRTTMIDRTITRASKKRRGFAVKRSLLVFIAIAVLVVGAVPLVTMNRGVLHWPAHTAAQVVIPGVVLSYQHSDNPGGFLCAMCAAGGMVWHNGIPVLWDDVKYGGLVPQPGPGDNMYDVVPFGDDCPHCIVYSGPASIQMMCGNRLGPPLIPQDVIYDMCELQAGLEVAANKACERHGFGVLDGTGQSPPEIQWAFQNYLGPPFQHNQWDASALTQPTLLSYMAGQFPVIWDDHNGWPSNMDLRWPIPPENGMQGHYKVIAGYDDLNNQDPTDDLALIFDPWPGYNDLKSINPTPLPQGAIPGPVPGMPDPYWQLVVNVLGDPNDLFLVEIAAIPEFSGLLIPIVGMTVIALVAIRFRTGGREP